jgi:hypothetical protein
VSVSTFNMKYRSIFYILPAGKCLNNEWLISDKLPINGYEKLKLNHRFLYHMMASDVFVLFFCFTFMLICTVTSSVITFVNLLEFLFRNPWCSSFAFWLFGDSLRELSLLPSVYFIRYRWNICYKKERKVNIPP